MTYLEDIALRFMIGAVVLLGVGLFFRFEMSVIELAALR
jgi:hypothetical protein